MRACVHACLRAKARAYICVWGRRGEEVGGVHGCVLRLLQISLQFHTYHSFICKAMYSHGHLFKIRDNKCTEAAVVRMVQMLVQRQQQQAVVEERDTDLLSATATARLFVFFLLVDAMQQNCLPGVSTL